MADKLVLQLEVDDKGTATIKNFAGQAKQALDGTTTSVGAQSKALGGLQNSWQMMAAGYASVVYLANQAMSVVGGLTQDFMQQESAEMRLGIAMRNQGDYTRASFRALKDYAGELQDVTTYADDAVLGMMAVLKTFGMADEQMKRSTRAALDWGAVMGGDVQGAAQLLGRAFVGSTEALSRYGIVVDASLSSSQKFESILNQLEARFGGAAQAELATYAGQWKQIGNIWSDVKEIIGLGLLKSIEAVIAGLSYLGGAFYKVLAGISGGLGSTISFIADQLKVIIGKDWKNFGEHLKEAGRGYEELAQAGFKTGQTYAGMLTTFDKVEKAMEKIKSGKAFKPIDEEEVKRQQKAAEELKKILEQLSDETVKMQEGETGIFLREYDKRYAKVKGNREAIDLLNQWATMRAMEILEKETKEEEKRRDENLKSFAIYYDEQQKIRDDIDEEEKKRILEGVKLEEQAQQDLLKSWSLYYEEQDDMIGQVLAKEEKTAAERWKIEQQLRQDIAAFTKNEYEFKKLALDKQLEDFKKFNVDRTLLDRWYAQQSKKLDEERILRSRDFFAGMKVAYDQDLREQKRWGEQGATIWRSVFGKGGATEQLVHSFIMDAWKGELKSALDYLRSWTDQVVAAFSKMIAEMVAQWLASKVGGLLGFGGGGGGGILDSVAGALGLGGGGSSGSGDITTAVNAASTASDLASGGGIFGTLAAGASKVAGWLGIGGGAGAGATEAAALAALPQYSAAMASAGTAGATGAAALAEGAASAGVTAGAAGAGMVASLIGPAVAIGAGAMLVSGIWSALNTPEYAPNPFAAFLPQYTPQGVFGGGYPSGLAEFAGSEASSQIFGQGPGGEPLFGGAKMLEYFKGDPWFDPENLARLYMGSTGRSITADSIRSGVELAWFRQQPHYRDVVEAIKSKRSDPEWWAWEEMPRSFARGGWIEEEVRGVGMRSGRGYRIAEGGRELVLPEGEAGRGNTYVFQFNSDVYGDAQEFAERFYEKFKRLERLGY